MQVEIHEHIHGRSGEAKRNLRTWSWSWNLSSGGRVSAGVAVAPAPAPNGNPPNPPCEPNIACIYWRSAGSKNEQGGRPAPSNGDIGAAPVGDGPDYCCPGAVGDGAVGVPVEGIPGAGNELAVAPQSPPSPPNGLLNGPPPPRSPSREDICNTVRSDSGFDLKMHV